MAIVALDATSYNTLVESNNRVVVHFWADWNRIDEQMRERLEEVNTSYGALIAFASFDTSPEEHFEICRRVRLVNLPSLCLYRSGKLVETIVGLGDRQRIVSGLERLLTAD